MAPLTAVFRFIRQNGKRLAVSVAGAVLVLAGLAMLVLPGPGVLVILAGLAVLGTEFAWAQTALDRTKEKARETGKKAKRVLRGKRR